MNRVSFHSRNRAQTLVFFLLSFGAIILLCGLAIDSGLLYLAKARLARAVDGAALAAVGNFHQSDDPTTNRNTVALIMRNFAVANFGDLSTINASLPAPTQTTYSLADGSPALEYTYNFNDGTTDAGVTPTQYRRYVQVTLQTGAGGQITSATCSARCPATTYFIGFAEPFFRDLKVSSSAIATRNPRLIMVVVDRSSSMLEPGGGAYGLPNAIVVFMNFFDTSSDYIGLVSFSSNARLEFPPTTNFLIAATNSLLDTYNTPYGTPGIDPEMESTNADFDPDYSTNGVRRMKFGGSTCADEGIRMGLEEMMANPGFNNPNVTKYLVIFTDGAWNCVRVPLAAPGYTNVVFSPQTALGAKKFAGSTLATVDYPMPIMSPYESLTNTLYDTANLFTNSGGLYSEYNPADHTNDVWQSQDGVAEPLPNNYPGGVPAFLEGAPTNVTGYPILAPNTYATNVNVWLQPGSVDYSYNSAGIIVGTYVSDYTNPTNTVNVPIPQGGSNVLVVPGYFTDGNITDSLDLNWNDNDYLDYQRGGFLVPYMWPDALTIPVNSVMRQLIFRNYNNMMNGYYIFRADDPLSSAVEPITGATRPLNGLGAYYPSAGVYWPFDLVGFDPFIDTFDFPGDTSHFMLRDATQADPTLGSSSSGNNDRNIAYTINMLSTNASPNWAGELFYRGTGGTGVVTGTGTTPVSQQITSAADYQLGATGWLFNFISQGLSPSVGSAILLNDTSHYGTGATNIINGQVLRAITFNGSNNSPLSSTNQCTPTASVTGGFVSDGAGHYYPNAMAYSGRPTHYYDFSQSAWVPFQNQHQYNLSPTTPHIIAVPLDYWKSQEYAWHARAAGVTIYTVGYGSLVGDSQQALLAQIANATNTTAGGGSNITFNPLQPIGQQFQATTTNEITADFQAIAQAINVSLTQ